MEKKDKNFATSNNSMKDSYDDGIFQKLICPEMTRIL